jgi:Putative peptidoglycan binding domain
MTMADRLAHSLAQLRREIDALAPNRSKKSDGWIGDADHRARPSRHNPNREGVVCALDITDDPRGGCPIHVIAEQIRSRPHPNLAYIISNGRVARRTSGFSWEPYTGSNKHNLHVHFAVGVGPDGDARQPYDDATRWGVSATGPVPVADNAKAPRKLKEGMEGEDVKGLQQILIGAGLLPRGADDGSFGPDTLAATKAFQRQLGVKDDGVVGPDTHAAIAGLFHSLAKKSA